MIAAVAVDVPLPHLDRTFDYRVPDEMAATVAVGVRVRVMFARRLVTGIVLALHEDATHATADLRAVVSTAVVLSPRMASLVRAVADVYAGTFSDVLRFAVPNRHARAETAALAAALPEAPQARAITGDLASVRGMQAFCERTIRGEALAASLEVPTLLDVEDVVADIALALIGAVSVVVVVPDAGDIDRVERALKEREVQPITVRSSDGPSVRQRAFTTISRSPRAVVLGTRSAAFAPINGPGVTIVVGDGNDALVEVQTPGWHAREVALARTATQGWSTLLVAHHRSIEVQARIAEGVVKPLLWPRELWRQRSVRVESVPERYDDADPLLHRLRIPPSVFRAMREALRTGPVLLSVAHRGYVTTVRCASCREAARCSACNGPIAVVAEGAPPRCRWCGTAGWTCGWCGGARVLFGTIGIERTGEELGRAFPDIPIRRIDAEHPLERMPDAAHLLLATPGMEPEGRAALGVVLDVDLVLGRHDLSAGAEAVRRWHEMAAHVAPGGRLLIVGSQTAPSVQALLRSDPAGYAEREYAERAEAGLPPAWHAVVVTAPAGNQAAAEIAAAVPGCRALGPAPAGERQRTLILHRDGAELRSAVRAMTVRRSAAKTLAGIDVRLDPLELVT